MVTVLARARLRQAFFDPVSSNLVFSVFHMDLDQIIALLAARQQRATYGAVAGLLRVAPKGLMQHRQHSNDDSWIVSADTVVARDARQGWPTGYIDGDIDPNCLVQCQQGFEGVIDNTTELQNFLQP